MTTVDTTTGEVVQLRALDRAHLALAEAGSLDEVKDIRDKAEALRAYAKQANQSLEMQNRCAELKLRSERKAGELLAGMPKNPGGRATDTTLGQVGVSRNQSSRWQRIASIPEPEFEALVALAFNEDKELTTAAALKLAKRLTATADERASRPDLSVITGDREPHGGDPDVVPDVFSAIVIDPPWRYDNVATRGAAEDHYGTMSLDELAALELPAADDSHLYLWTTNSFLRPAFDLIDEWGFTYKTCLTWCKPQIGMGNWFRNSTEHVLFGVRGKHPTLRNNVPTHFVADRTRHSAKPESFYDLVEECSPGPWLEMFARRRRFGWHVWGNES